MKHKCLRIVCAGILFLLALLLTLYPMISSRYNAAHQAKIQTSYQEVLEQTDTTELARTREQANAYNASIKPGTMGEAYSPDAMLTASKDYVNQLNVNGNGIMGYIEIPKIDVDLPIYHGTESETLDKGVGHLLGSSLPVGGESTHTILSGHSGMASQKMFTDLEQLREGDVFYLRVLDEVLAYQVKAILTAEPRSTTFLGVVPGEDLCTLVTCTPTGVNTHRLLVRGTRIPYEEAVAVEESTQQEEETTSHWESQYWLGIRLGLVVMFCIVLLLNVVLMVKKRKHAKGTIAERKSRLRKKKGGRYVRK